MGQVASPPGSSTSSSSETGGLRVGGGGDTCVRRDHGKDQLTGGHLWNPLGQESSSSDCALGCYQNGRDLTQIWDLRSPRVVCGNFQAWCHKQVEFMLIYSLD